MLSSLSWKIEIIFFSLKKNKKLVFYLGSNLSTHIKTYQILWTFILIYNNEIQLLSEFSKEEDEKGGIIKTEGGIHLQVE